MKVKILVTTFVLFFFVACFTPHGIYHIVKPGQTLYTIAKTYDVELYKLMQVNKIKDPTTIKPGDRIFIPGATRQRYVPSTAPIASSSHSSNYTVNTHKGTGEKVSSKNNRSSKNIANIEVPNPEIKVELPKVKKELPRKTARKKIEKRSLYKGSPKRVSSNNNGSTSHKKVIIALKVPRLVWPVKGKVVSSFGWRGPKHHDGIDIAAPEGTPVVAAADGIVIYAGNGFKGYGNLIVIKHTPRVFTIYAHNKKNLVRKGQKVKQGQVIALVGSTGNATGPHLHFELRIGNKPVNPLKYLPIN